MLAEILVASAPLPAGAGAGIRQKQQLPRARLPHSAPMGAVCHGWVSPCSTAGQGPMETFGSLVLSSRRCRARPRARGVCGYGQALLHWQRKAVRGCQLCCTWERPRWGPWREGWESGTAQCCQSQGALSVFPGPSVHPRAQRLGCDSGTAAGQLGALALRAGPSSLCPTLPSGGREMT